MHKMENMGNVELATVAFGQSFQITPIQLATTVSSLINGGRRITPHFGVSVLSADGLSGRKLEYPVEDVADFIKYGGQNCLMERYWKVYHNVERARAVFAAYDAAKDQAMGEVIAGYPLHLVAVS